MAISRRVDSAPSSEDPILSRTRARATARAMKVAPRERPWAEVVCQMVRSHQAELARYLHCFGCDEGSAEDIVQDTFLDVLRRPFVVYDVARTRAYLRTVARNKYLMSERARRARPTALDVASVELLWTSHGSDQGWHDYLDALRFCLDRLSPRARECVRLRYGEVRSRTEIGRALAMTRDGVKTLLRRARAVLHDCIAPRLAR